MRTIFNIIENILVVVFIVLVFMFGYRMGNSDKKANDLSQKVTITKEEDPDVKLLKDLKAQGFKCCITWTR